MMQPRPQYLQRHQIDTKKWDECIDNAPNGLVYACSFYLDNMAVNWDALVLGDYEAVMPLTWKRKWGIYYLYQPFCTAQLGIFSSLHIDQQLVAVFIDNIPSVFRYIDIDLNESNHVLNRSYVKSRKNYVLQLASAYDALRSNYNRHARRKLKKAADVGLEMTDSISVETIVALSSKMMEGRSRINLAEYERFIRLCNAAPLHVEACNVMAAIDQKGQVVASDINIVYKKRVYSLLAGNTPFANKTGGFYFVLDHLIKRYAGSGYLLDFEGSDLPGIAFLFECLGGQLTWYPHIIMNRLPPAIRWMKRQ